MKYLISTHELEWHNRLYEVEADSENEAIELVEEHEIECNYDNFDVVEQIDIEWIRENEN